MVPEIHPRSRIVRWLDSIQILHGGWQMIAAAAASIVSFGGTIVAGLNGLPWKVIVPLTVGMAFVSFITFFLVIGAAEHWFWVRKRKRVEKAGAVPVKPAEPQRRYVGVDVQIADLVVDGSVVRDKTFSGCMVVGPAVLLQADSTDLVKCILQPSMAIWLKASQREIPGAIVLENCIFRHCEFRSIGFAVPSKDQEKWTKL